MNQHTQLLETTQEEPMSNSTTVTNLTGGTSGRKQPGQAHRLSGQRLVNVLVRGMLSTPLVARLLGRRLILLHVVGRKTGTRYSVPTAYHLHDGSILVGTQFPWGRNLRTGEPIKVRYRGSARTADVQVIEDEEGVIDYYRIMCRENHPFAQFHNIRIDADGEPNPQDLRRTWQSGSRVFRLTLR
jgi:hypothetical protein